MDPSRFISQTTQYLMNTYGLRSLMLSRGEGAWVWDVQGNKYLDFLSGIGVNNLGHCHPRVVNAIQEQAARLLHCSNLYYIEAQLRLAEKLCEHSFAERCFFANSGAEANEAALKLARYWANREQSSRRPSFVAFDNSFHGRTFATLSATGQSKVQQGFEPFLPSFKFARFNDLESVKAELDGSVCAVIVEPVQGEGGVHPATQEFLSGLRQLCDEEKLVLIFDEIQCGLGRLGYRFAYEYYEVEPDLLTLAKALAGGIPIGALLGKGEVADAFEPGTHASTFGGNPLACTVALAALEVLFDSELLERVRQLGEYMITELRKLNSARIKEVRGIGLMLGIELTEPAKPLVEKCQEQGLLVGTAGEKVLRLLPPLIISEQEAERGLAIVRRLLAS